MATNNASNEPTAASGKVLQGQGVGVAANFSTATYPATTTSQQILYSSAANTVSELTTANSKFPATNSSGTLAMRALSVVVQTFTSNGTYTPTTGMLYCIIEVVGSGGGGAGIPGTSGNNNGGGSGGAGEYARGVFSASDIGASQSVTCPAGGNGGTAGQNNGSDGSTTSVGALISAGGGKGGKSGSSGSGFTNPGGNGGSGGSGGSFRSNGAAGGLACGSYGVFNCCLPGASGPWGGGAPSVTNSSPGPGAGTNAGGYGSGGSGAFNFNTSSTFAGGNGSSGIVIVTEFVIN